MPLSVFVRFWGPLSQPMTNGLENREGRQGYTL